MNIVLLFQFALLSGGHPVRLCDKAELAALRALHYVRSAKPLNLDPPLPKRDKIVKAINGFSPLQVVHHFFYKQIAFDFVDQLDSLNYCVHARFKDETFEGRSVAKTIAKHVACLAMYNWMTANGYYTNF
jgi:hypothetical protein